MRGAYASGLRVKREILRLFVVFSEGCPDAGLFIHSLIYFILLYLILSSMFSLFSISFNSFLFIFIYISILDAQGFIQQLSALNFQQSALNDFAVAPAETKPIDLITLATVWAKRVMLFLSPTFFLLLFVLLLLLLLLLSPLSFSSFFLLLFNCFFIGSPHLRISHCDSVRPAEGKHAGPPRQLRQPRPPRRRHLEARYCLLRKLYHR